LLIFGERAHFTCFGCTCCICALAYLAFSYIRSLRSYSLPRSYGLFLEVGLLQYVSYLTAKYILDLAQVMRHYVVLSGDLNLPGFQLRVDLLNLYPGGFSILVVGQVIDDSAILADVLISWVSRAMGFLFCFYFPFLASSSCTFLSYSKNSPLPFLISLN